ncbi:hypothetical protein [Dactylosporangium sp. CA-139066]|uniref:hypothetical protein n=1 Tax=Dactylosporangium sp. CA-139066 TaxID=3239930 RepID=UPI003D8FDA80
MTPAALVGKLVRYHGSIPEKHGVYVVSGTHEGYALGIGTRLFLSLPEEPESIELSNVRAESVTLVSAPGVAV